MSVASMFYSIHEWIFNVMAELDSIYISVFLNYRNLIQKFGSVLLASIIIIIQDMFISYKGAKVFLNSNMPMPKILWNTNVLWLLCMPFQECCNNLDKVSFKSVLSVASAHIVWPLLSCKSCWFSFLLPVQQAGRIKLILFCRFLRMDLQICLWASSFRGLSWTSCVYCIGSHMPYWA